MRVLLWGYYGQQNYGDDVLLSAAVDWVTQVAPTARLSVFTAASAPDYLLGMLSAPISLLRPGEEARFDLVVHGGGGPFFDFRPGPWTRHALNATIRAMGASRYARAREALQGVTGRRRVRWRMRIGAGIGVGRYVASSSKLSFHAAQLGSMDAVMVRDPASAEHLRRMGVRGAVRVGSDLAFRTGAWTPTGTHGSHEDETFDVGIVLRDWPYGSAGVWDHVHAGARRLMASGRRVRAVSLDPLTDTDFVERFGRDMPVLQWDPATGLRPFAERLSRHRCLLTARAHGALCGACLGVPAVVIELEPKLRHVSDMLPESATRIALTTSSDRIVDEVEQMLGAGGGNEATALDVALNARRLDDSLDWLAGRVAQGSAAEA